MKRRIVSILTCVVMAIAFMPAGAFAAQYNYAAVGDASTAGYGMAANVGYPTLVKGTYPALIGDVISANGHTGKVSQLAMQKMRVEDFRAMIDDSYDGDSYTATNFPNFKQNRTIFKDSIKKANLITFNLGTVNIGSYFFYLAGDPANRCDNQAIKRLVKDDKNNETGTDGIVKAFKEEVTKVSNDIKALNLSGSIDIDSTLSDLFDKYIDAAAYAYYSFRENCGAAIAKVRELNPNAKFVVLGIGNMLDNLKVTVKHNNNTAEIKIGEIFNSQLVQRVNTILRNNAQNAGATFDGTAGDAETFLDEIKNYDESKNGYSVSSQFKLFCDVLEDDLEGYDSNHNPIPYGLKNDITKYVNSTAFPSYQKYTKTERINAGMRGVYHTAATVLKDVANINNVNLVQSDLLSLMDDDTKREIAEMGGKIMADLRAKCLSNGSTNYAMFPETASWTETNKASYLSSFYGTTHKCFGMIVMAVGIHSQIGNGFFVHPSAKGHAQLKNIVMKDIHSSSLHNYGGWVTKNADVGVAGSKTRTCGVCGKEEVVKIPAKNPAGTSLTKVTKGKKSFTAKWKKPSGANLSKITGYQLRYSLKRSMAGAKTVTIANKNTVSKKIKKLKAKKKYFVQVRTYRKTDKNYYSGWSATKSVKTK